MKYKGKSFGINSDRLYFTQNWSLALNVLYYTIPHELCMCEVKDVHGLQSFITTHSEESDSLLFILFVNNKCF